MTARRRPGAVIAALALAIAACGQAQASSPPIGVALPPASAPTSVPTAGVTTTTTIEAPTSSTSAPPSTVDPHLTFVATARSHVTRLVAYDGPNGDPLRLPFAVPNPHQFGGPLTLMVVAGEPAVDWVEVQLPVRPNGSTGWIPMADYTLSETRIHAEVELSTTTVRVFDGDELVAESQAVIGSEETPTPLGTFYIAAKKRNDESENHLGPWALVLSSYSEVLSEFSGGLPVIAIHGTNRPDQVGEAITFGCVRVPNDVIDLLAANVPVGAPIVIAA